MELPRIKPCPFCGCTNAYPVSPSLGHSSWRVFCDDCHAEGPQIPSYNSDEGEARCQWVWQIRYPAQSDALLDAEGVKLYWYRQGKDDGVEHERTKIVAWLREQDGHGYDAMRADCIEAGEHLK